MHLNKFNMLTTRTVSRIRSGRWTYSSYLENGCQGLNPVSNSPTHRQRRDLLMDRNPFGPVERNAVALCRKMSPLSFRNPINCQHHHVNYLNAIVNTRLLHSAVGNGFTKNNNSSANGAVTTPPKHDWNRAVSEAERIVGYPTSFLSLRWLLSDEIANVALHLRKLIGSSHPLLKTAKHLLYNGKNTMQAWGLIVLLVSKAAGHCSSVPEMEEDKSAGLLHSQRGLAEVTEMIRISQLVHNSLVNLQNATEIKGDPAALEDMTFGNKIGLLTGDYLLSHSCVELANLRNQEVVELISSAVRDFSESEFIGDRDEQNNPLPSKPNGKAIKQGLALSKHVEFDANDALVPLNIDDALGIPEKEWECRNILSAGSLLGKSCKAAIKLARLSEELQHQAYLFGTHLSLAWQACLDAEPFQTNTLPLDGTFSLISAPVLFHLEYDPSLYEEIEKGKMSIECIDYAKIHRIILTGPGLERTKELQSKHTASAMRVLQYFPPNDARRALENIILAMQDL